MKQQLFVALSLIFSLCFNAQAQRTTTASDSITKTGQPMKTVIIYSTKHGTTEKVANMIAEKIAEGNSITLISLADESKPDISGYDKVILGTSIYMGKPRDEMKNFTKNNKTAFVGKTVGLFVCGGEKREDRKQKELQNAYPSYLHSIATVESFLGGEYNFEKMSSMEKRVIKMRAKTSESTSFLDHNAIDDFSNKIKN